MRGKRATGKIQRNNYRHGSCGPSLTGKTMSVLLIFTQGTHWNVKIVEWEVALRPVTTYNSAYQSPSILFWLSLRPLLKLDFYHFNCLCDPQSDLIRAGNYLRKSKTQCLNAIKAEQLMAGKQLLISTSLINPFGTWSTQSRTDKLNRLLSLLSSSRVTVFQLCTFKLNFKGHAVAIMEFPDWPKIKWRDFRLQLHGAIYRPDSFV